MEAESVPVSSGALVFGPKETAGKVTKATHVALMYVKRALASAAVRTQLNRGSVTSMP